MCLGAPSVEGRAGEGVCNARAALDLEDWLNCASHSAEATSCSSRSTSVSDLDAESDSTRSSIRKGVPNEPPLVQKRPRVSVGELVSKFNQMSQAPDKSKQSVRLPHTKPVPPSPLEQEARRASGARVGHTGSAANAQGLESGCKTLRDASELAVPSAMEVKTRVSGQTHLPAQSEGADQIEATQEGWQRDVQPADRPCWELGSAASSRLCNNEERRSTANPVLFAQLGIMAAAGAAALLAVMRSRP
mmetsp:Transcript_41297/g.95615  ORF Transcript_41297/g.95615 Transcript_41297/m.95615 type:complete len:247 (-) Transcript_41297:50-790(-)